MRKNDVRWTNESVSHLKETTPIDPRQAIVDRARSVVLEAMEAGWNGPPFDVFALADYMKISTLPNESVPDARIKPTSHGRFQIEYNPNRSRGRIRYSIAHELAHTLFDDCSNRIRNRIARNSVEKDEWQLEMLCNLAASELLMPVGSFPDLGEESLNIDNLMRLRKAYDVSAEAILLRVVRLTKKPCAVFCSSYRPTKKISNSQYFIDYVCPSLLWDNFPSKPLIPPQGSILNDCTAIGYTAIGNEQWPTLGDMHIEVIGLPPYPGHVLPRVAGIMMQKDLREKPFCTITYLKGDATKPRGNGKRIVAQVVNDKTPRWGAGFGRAVKAAYPRVQRDFVHWAENNKEKFCLGSTHSVKVTDNISFFQMICQKGYGPSLSPRIRYEMLRLCLHKLAEDAVAENASVHMPRIACGEAGGTWPVVSEIIDNCLCRKGIDVTVYDLP